jgi:hypothetical protein
MSATELTAAPHEAAADILDLPPIEALIEAPAGALPPHTRRLRPPMQCYWGVTEACPRDGRITSLSAEGCFVKTKAEPADDIFVNCWLPTERWLLLRGRVTRRRHKVGFDVAFTGLSDAEREILSALLDYLDETQPPSDARAD